ncbi:anti-sigma factor domain-containing protein [Deinococcus alpinitundrae]|uniref:anti-sigma factor n=1 Tax=Deinococcus alpinitundrae TaxID=468913 RepID=UPI001379DB40|nr:anti-sigma factor [Deinococcus alpinitundrae]
MPNESESTEWQEQLSLYAFGLLDGAQAASVERRLTSEPLWQAELRALQDTLAALADPAPVPVGSAERLLERVRADREQSEPAQTPLVQSSPVPPAAPVAANLPLTAPTRSPYLGWLVAVALVAAVAAVLILPRLSSTPERQLAEYQTQPGAVSTPLTTQGGQSLGTAVRLKDGRAFVLLVADAPQGRAYQAWQVVGKAPASLGVFKGRSFLSAPLSGPVTLAVSVEPPSGSPQPTTTPILAQTL